MGATAAGRNWAEMSDQELALRCSTQIVGCMDELVGRYESRIRDCASRMALDRDHAEDAVQEIFLRMVASLPKFQGRSAFGTWLYRLAHNTCIDSFRRGTRESRMRAPAVTGGEETAGDLFDSIPSDFGDPEAELDERIQECYLGQALADLPADYREIVRLRLGEGRSNEEVARMLGATVDSVKAKLRRARRQLREHLLTRRWCPVCHEMGALRISETGAVE